IIIILVSQNCFSQELENQNWSGEEKKRYETLADSIVERKQKRLERFRAFFIGYFKSTVDSIGLENLDAKPIRFYKEHKIYEPFEKVYKDIEDRVFVYYRKENPEEPLETLLFSSK